MSSFSDGLEEGMRNGFCDVAREGVAGGLLFAGLTATSGYGLAAGLLVSGASLVSYAMFCGRPPGPDFFGRRPFTGGQCDGVRYQCSAGATATDSRNGATFLVAFGGLVWGKIHRCEMVVDEEDFNTATVIIDGSQDDDIFEVVSVGSSDDGENPRFTYTDFFATCVRQDGLPDLCGDPPRLPPVLEPGDNVYPSDITYIDDNDVAINLPITFTFGIPRVDINGTLNMPVNLKFDVDIPVNVTGTLNFNTGNFNVYFGDPAAPAGGDPPVVTDPDNPPPPPPPGTPTPDPPLPGEDPEVNRRQNIKACLVTVSEADVNATRIVQDNNPDIFAPALGYVQFYISQPNGGGWTEDIPVKNVRQFIPCPWRLGAIDVRGTPRGTSVMVVTPVYTVETYNPVFPPESIAE